MKIKPKTQTIDNALQRKYRANKKAKLALAVEEGLEADVIYTFVGIDGEAVRIEETFEVGFAKSEADERDGITTTTKNTISRYVCIQAVDAAGNDVVEPLLTADARDRIPPTKPLSTLAVMDWLFQSGFKDKTLVGFYLGYDFENWLVDLSMDAIEQLYAGGDVQYGKYLISYVPNKIFKVECGKARRTVYSYDGYFPGSFIGQCEEHELVAKFDKVLGVYTCGFDYDAGKPIILDDSDERVRYAKILDTGKADRSVFNVSNLAFGVENSIMEYNKVECLLMARMMDKLAKTVNSGFRKLDEFKTFSFAPKMSYGAGALANAVYKQINWKTDKPDFKPLTGFSHEDEPKFYDKFPFFKSFFGGRIESAAVGEWKSDGTSVWAYDLNSAYPAAMAKMPDWTSTNRKWVTGSLITDVVEGRFAGMALVKWDLPTDWFWYPFPYRQNGNVYFPNTGKGWVTLLEVYAFLDTVENGGDYITISDVVYLDNTQDLGDGLQKCGITRTGGIIAKLYKERARLKKLHDHDELAYKLALNSFYGKLVQQIGVSISLEALEAGDFNGVDLKNLNDFAASWTTGYCRAMMWRGIAPVKAEPTIIAVQTDGIYSTKPLPHLDTSKDSEGLKVLGLWDCEEFSEYCNLMAGIYRYKKVGSGKHTVKMRGFPRKSFDFDKAKSVLFEGSSYVVKSETFVKRLFAKSRPDTLKDCALQWVQVEKDFKISLSAKRAYESGKDIIRLTNGVFWTKPKEQKGLLSNPYPLDFIPELSVKLFEESPTIMDALWGLGDESDIHAITKE